MIETRRTKSASAPSKQGVLRAIVYGAFAAAALCCISASADTGAAESAAGNKADNTANGNANGGTHGNADRGDYSQANRLLFMSNHLGNVDAPSRLQYGFTRSGDGKASFDDHINLTVASGKNQAKNVHIEFFSGKRNHYVPDISNAHGNPVVMMFLQYDVLEMAKRTGGNWRYFQRRIKFALQRDATVKDGTAKFEGRQIDVKRVSVEPFAGEKTHRDALSADVNKQYVFTLSDAVPGGVLEIHSETPMGKDNPEIVERLALKSADNPANTDNKSEGEAAPSA